MIAVNDMVIVKKVFSDKVNKESLIILPDTDQSKQRYAAYHGEVIAVGPKYPCDLKPGDIVYFVREEGVRLHAGDTRDEIWAMKERWVVAKLEEK